MTSDREMRDIEREAKATRDPAAWRRWLEAKEDAGRLSEGERLLLHELPEEALAAAAAGGNWPTGREYEVHPEDGPIQPFFHEARGAGRPFWWMAWYWPVYKVESGRLWESFETETWRGGPGTPRQEMGRVDAWTDITDSRAPHWRRDEAQREQSRKEYLASALRTGHDPLGEVGVAPMFGPDAVRKEAARLLGPDWKANPPRRRNSDEPLRDLERRARAGDAGAMRELLPALNDAGRQFVATTADELDLALRTVIATNWPGLGQSGLRRALAYARRAATMFRDVPWMHRSTWEYDFRDPGIGAVALVTEGVPPQSGLEPDVTIGFGKVYGERRLDGLFQSDPGLTWPELMPWEPGVGQAGVLAANARSFRWANEPASDRVRATRGALLDWLSTTKNRYRRNPASDEEMRRLEREARAGGPAEKIALARALDEAGRGSEWPKWMSVTTRRRDLEERARADYAAVEGKAILVPRLAVYRYVSGGSAEEYALDPPALVRVSKGDLWTEWHQAMRSGKVLTEWLDVEWGCELLEDRHEFRREGDPWKWYPRAIGTSRSLDGGVETWGWRFAEGVQ